MWVEIWTGLGRIWIEMDWTEIPGVWVEMDCQYLIYTIDVITRAVIFMLSWKVLALEQDKVLKFCLQSPSEL